MTPPSTASFDIARQRLEPIGQAHVLRWWDALNALEREQLLADIAGIPWDLVHRLIPTHVLSVPTRSVPDDLQPAAVLPCDPVPTLRPRYDEAVRVGRELLRAGKVAAFTVAGGQGTRLGYEGPKGAVVVTPVGGRTLFQLFAEMVHAAREEYGVTIPWYVMTSPANHGQTLSYFEKQRFFGLPERDVILFAQGMMPAFDFQGRLLLEARHRLAAAPDGHGGSLRALVKSGAIADMRRRGVEIISYFQVDNPLVKPFDPLFLGLHSRTGSQMSTKVSVKADDFERVGNVCGHDGKVTVIEYTEFPDHFARLRNPDGSRRFNAGNLAIHLLDVDFVFHLGQGDIELPFRRAEKIVPFVDPQGVLQKPATPNAVKLETFIFDVLPFAQNPLVLEVDRAEEFSPVKNATGEDSLDTSRRHQNERACCWLESAGVAVPRRPDGAPLVTIAISPRLALDADDLKAKADRLPRLQPGDSIYLE